MATGSAKLASQWPSKPTISWRQPLGSGYAGAAVVGNVVLIPHREKEQERLVTLNLVTGKKRWERAWPATFRSRVGGDHGPRCVPSIQEGLVVFYGAAGDLHCLRLNDGAEMWSRNLRKEYDADDGYFGAGSSPLVADDRVIVCLGGKSAGIVAVELATGKTIWTATDYDASYASPILLAEDSTKALVVTRLTTVLLDVRDGSVLSEIRFGARGPTVNAATPIAIGGGRYALTASYGIGMTVVEIEGDQLREVTRGSDALSSQYNTPVWLGDRLVGVNGRQDMGVAALRAVNPTSEEVIWEQDQMGTTHLIKSDALLIGLSLDGTLRLIDATGTTMRELAKQQLPAGSYEALPALSGNRLLVRVANRGSSELLCVQLPTR